MAQVTIDVNACGGTKTCFKVPDSCSGSDCDYLVSWSVLKDQNRKVEFELLGKTDGWVAIGLSDDKNMVGGACKEYFTHLLVIINIIYMLH